MWGFYWINIPASKKLITRGGDKEILDLKRINGHIKMDCVGLVWIYIRKINCKFTYIYIYTHTHIYMSDFNTD